MQTLTLPLSVPRSACRLSKGNMMLLKSQQSQCVRFNLALSSRQGFRFTDHYFCADSQSHSHAPACLSARPVICQLVALVCMSWHGGQIRVVMSTGALFPVCPEVKETFEGCCRKCETCVGKQDRAEGRIKQPLPMSWASGCHMMPYGF